MARVLLQSTGGGQNQRNPNTGLQHAGAGRKSNPRSTAQNVSATPAVTSPGPSRKLQTSRRQAAHPHGRRGRNGNGHHPQIRRETRRATGGEPGREPEPDSHRPGPEPSIAVMDPHDSALTFLSITAFWIAMNVLLWRAEYGSHGTGVSVRWIWCGGKF